MTLPPPDPDQTKLDLALSYAKRSWKLLLLAPDTKTPINKWREGKRDGFDPTALPRGRDARQRYLRGFAASSDPALIRAWLDEWPDAGLGVDCAASNLFAIDLDQKPAEGKDGNDALGRVFLKYFPSAAQRDGEPPLPDYADPKNPFGTPRLSRSPSGGQHLIYFMDPLFGGPGSEDKPWAITDLGHAVLGVKGLDIKWNGYVGIPSGDGRREWLNDVEPGPLPGWLYDALVALRGARAGDAAEPSEPGLWTVDDVREYLDLLDVAAFRHDGAWDEVMMGLHHVGGDGAFAPFLGWCVADPEYRYDAAKITTRWRSLGKREGDATRGEGTLLNVLGRGSYLRAGANVNWRPRYRRAENVFDDVPQPEAPREEPVRRTGFDVTRLIDVQKRDVEFLWEPYVPRGEVTLIDGDPNVGKSTLMYDLAARITTGAPMPLDTGGLTRSPQNVLIVNAEDANDTTVRPRLEAAGADLSRVYSMNAVWNASQIEGLEATVDSIGDVGMVVIDAIMSALGGADAHRDNEVRSRLLPLAMLAKRRKMAVLAGRHLHKGEKSKAIYAGGGSIGISAIARGELLVGPNPDAPDTETLVALVKWNLVPAGTPSVRFKTARVPVEGLRRTQPRIEWLGTSALTAHDLVRFEPEQESKGALRMRCGRFLARYFAERHEAKRVDVLAAAKAEGIEADSKNWERARGDLGIISTNGGPNAIWSRADEAAPPLDAADPLGQK